MIKRYGTSIAIMAITLLGLVFAVVGSASWAASGETQVRDMDSAKKQSAIREQLVQNRLAAAAGARPLIRDFIKSWEPYVQPFPKSKDFAASAMAVLERDAQATGAGSSEKTIPVIGDYRLGTRSIQVQRISLTATGEISRVLQWLGAIQEHLPYGRIEGLTLAGYGSSGCALRITMAHPIPQEIKPGTATPAR